MGEVNGLLHCEAKNTWHETRAKVDEMHTSMLLLTKDLAYLKKLECLEEIALSNREIRDKLITPATGTTRIETKVIMPIIYTLCFMLTAVIIWFTGIEPSLPHRGLGHTEVAK